MTIINITGSEMQSYIFRKIAEINTPGGIYINTYAKLNPPLDVWEKCIDYTIRHDFRFSFVNILIAAKIMKHLSNHYVMIEYEYNSFVICFGMKRIHYEMPLSVSVDINMQLNMYSETPRNNYSGNFT